MGEQLVISISREFGSGGHEIAAHIVELGDEVNRTEWAVGDKVVR